MSKVIKRELMKHIDPSLMTLLQETKAMIAGGAMISVLNRDKPNDLDVYFKNKYDLAKFVSLLPSVHQPSFACMSQTSRSAIFTDNKLKVNIVYLDTFASLREVFASFDYTCCMAGYDFEHDCVATDDSFWHDHSTQSLRYTQQSRFPIGALVRLQKYVQRGYTIDYASLLRLYDDLRKIEIEDGEELVNQLGGMYGLDVELKGKTLEEVIDLIENADVVDAAPTFVEFDKMYLYDDSDIRLFGDSIVSVVDGQVMDNLDTDRDDDFAEIEFPVMVYKWAKASDEADLARSYFREKFDYRLGSVVEDAAHGIYVDFLYNIGSLTYRGNSDSVLVGIRVDSMNDIRTTTTGNPSGFRINRGTVISIGE